VKLAARVVETPSATRGSYAGVGGLELGRAEVEIDGPWRHDVTLPMG
jgi:hypothetical protein